MNRFEGVRTIFIIGIIGLVVSTGVNYAQPPAPLQQPRDLLQQGRGIYLGHCAACHGINGDGKGPQAKKLKQSPTNFSDAKLMKSRTDNDLEQAILVGKPGTAMPGYGTILRPQELSSLIKYLHSLATSP